MGWLNWNSDPRDDENETEIRGAMSVGIVVFVIAMVSTIAILTGCSVRIFNSGTESHYNEKQVEGNASNIELVLPI